MNTIQDNNLTNIIHLLCIFTINNDKYDIDEMYNEIQNNDKIYDIDIKKDIQINDFCLEYIDVDIFNRLNKNYNNIYNYDSWRYYIDKYLQKYNNYAYKVKKELQEIINDPRKLLIYINKYINNKIGFHKPILIKFNDLPFEVSKIINEHLEYDITGITEIELLFNSIFSDTLYYYSNRKWLIDTTDNGIFCIYIYLKLMKILDSKIPDKYERKKHILENMLYIYISYEYEHNFWCKLILDPLQEFKLNIFNDRHIITEKNSNISSIKFDIVIYNTWINNSTTLLWLELKNIFFKLTKKRSIIIFIHENNKKLLFSNIEIPRNNILEFKVSRTINNILCEYNIGYQITNKYLNINNNKWSYIFYKYNLKKYRYVDNDHDVTI